MWRATRQRGYGPADIARDNGELNVGWKGNQGRGCGGGASDVAKDEG